MSETDYPKPERSLFKRFLVPEEAISLRIIFDNVKNYAVCAAIYAAAVALSRNISTISSGETEEDPELLLIYGLIIAGSLLTIFCILQSLEIYRVGYKNMEARIIENIQVKHKVVAWLIFMFFWYAGLLLFILTLWGIAFGVTLALTGISGIEKLR